MNRCHFCGGELVQQLTTFVYENNSQVSIVRNVPAFVCKQCGEKEYTPETTHRILTFLKHPPTRQILCTCLPTIWHNCITTTNTLRFHPRPHRTDERKRCHGNHRSLVIPFIVENTMQKSFLITGGAGFLVLTSPVTCLQKVKA